MKKILIILVILLFLCGCDYNQEFYNEKDKIDFENGNCIKFDIVQLKNVIDKDTLKENNLDGGFFLFMGSISSKSTEKTILTNKYYGYLKNKNGGIYFAEIPSNKVRIYEDAEAPCIVAFKNIGYIDTEFNWDNYDVFNLHIPKGSIIPRVKLNFNIDDLK
jgi:hypothetical protein